MSTLTASLGVSLGKIGVFLVFLSASASAASPRREDVVLVVEEVTEVSPFLPSPPGPVKNAIRALLPFAIDADDIYKHHKPRNLSHFRRERRGVGDANVCGTGK